MKTSSPTTSAASPVNNPSFKPMNVTVRSACTASPNIRPVSVHSPEGISTATTGSPAALIAWIALRYGSRTSPVKPVPSKASSTMPRNSD
ncbi:hypothetical protein D3C81_1890670 [compost metagenome]